MFAILRVAAFLLIMACPVLAQDYKTLSRNLAQDLFARHFEKVASQFDERWAQAMPASKVADFLNTLTNLGGEFREITGIRLGESKESHTASVACRFEKRTLHLIVAFDTRNRVTALNFALTDPLQPPFDETADAQAAIKTAVDDAAIDSIRVLVVWGANDNSGSKQFLESLKVPAISERILMSEYKLAKINVGHMNKNINLARRYSAKLKADALPALTILDAAGSVVANTSASALRTQGATTGIDPAKVVAFLKLHQAPAPNSSALFEAALNQAKSESKMVFVWFSAPW